MCLFDRILLIISVVFFVLGVINGFRHQILTLISLLACTAGILFFQNYLLASMIHFTKEPILHFVGFLLAFFISFLVLKNIIVAITYSRGVTGRQSWASHIFGGIIGVSNVWVLTFASLTVAANHSETQRIAAQLYRASFFVNMPVDSFNIIKSHLKSRHVSKKIRTCSETALEEPVK